MAYVRSLNASKLNFDAVECAWRDFQTFIETEHVPALLFWGSCGQCNSYRKTILQSDEFE